MSKPVSMIELFYDLVFVYMISKATGLIHHLHHGVVEPFSLIVFAFVVIVFINSWMVQSVFVNRYGESSWTDIGFSFINMVIVLYMSNTFSSELNANLRPFFLAAGLLSLTLCLQYLIVYWRTKVKDDRAIARVFAGILGVRTIALLGAAWLPLTVGIIVAVIGVGISWVAPGFTGRYTHKHPIIFAHLLERLTELSIVMFGETIVGIANYFTRTSFSFISILIFGIVASLFFAYITQFDHFIDEHRQGETGNLLIYLHYLIIFGISMVTVALKFVAEPEADATFAISFLYVGIGLFYLGLRIARYYNLAQFRQSSRFYWWILFLIVAGYGWCISADNFVVTVSATAVVLVISCGLLVRQLYRYGNVH